MHQDRVLFLPAIASEGEGMIKADQWHEIHSRFKLKESKKSIARALGLSVLTVRKILRQPEPQPYERQKSESALLSPHKDYILRRLAAVGFCAQAIFEELRVRGYRGSYDVVKRFVSPLRAEVSIDRLPSPRSTREPRLKSG